MTTAHIRPARPDDQPIIRAMVRSEGLDPTHLHWSHFVVVEMDGQVVGIGQIRPYRAGPELGSLVVLEAYRGHGIGGQIVRELLARQPGDVYLECPSEMIPYYERFGFQEIRWQDAPMPLKLKAGLGGWLARRLGVQIAVMKRAFHRDAEY